MFVPQITQAASNVGLHPKEKDIQNKVITFAGTQEDKGEEMVCGEGAGELTLQLLLSVKKTICATGPFHVRLRLGYLWDLPTMN